MKTWREAFSNIKISSQLSQRKFLEIWSVFKEIFLSWFPSPGSSLDIFKEISNFVEEIWSKDKGIYLADTSENADIWMEEQGLRSSDSGPASVSSTITGK